MTDDSAAPFSLRDHSALVVEDEAIISFFIQDLLEELGCTSIWKAASVQSAMGILADNTPHFAVLDVNLNGELVYPVAEHLCGIGKPFVFTTGYGRVGMPDKWNDRPVLQKPYDAYVLSRALADMLAAMPAI